MRLSIQWLLFGAIVLFYCVECNGFFQGNEFPIPIEVESDEGASPKEIASELGARSSCCFDLFIVLLYTIVFVATLRLSTGEDFKMGPAPLLFGFVSSVVSTIIIVVCGFLAGKIGLGIGGIIACGLVTVAIWKIVKTEFNVALIVGSTCTVFLVLIQVVIGLLAGANNATQ